jgi:predicted phosphodiesterase
MKYIRLISDAHMDVDFQFAYPRVRRQHDALAAAMELIWEPEATPEDHDSALVLAGDLWEGLNILKKKYGDGRTWIERVAARFKYVIFVLGNHDYWHGNLTRVPMKVRDLLSNLDLHNVFFLEKDAVVLDQVKFVGATLWTDVNKGDPITALSVGYERQANNGFKDFQKIKVGPNFRRLHVNDLIGQHIQSKQFIFDNAFKDHPDQTLVVVTHMAPSYGSVAERYRTEAKRHHNHMYFSELGSEIAYSEIDYWLHGHTHHVIDYKLGDTRVLCNPRGYVGYGQNTSWDPCFRIGVDNVDENNGVR